jgi:hypothetical protein
MGNGKMNSREKMNMSEFDLSMECKTRRTTYAERQRRIQEHSPCFRTGKQKAKGRSFV